MAPSWAALGLFGGPPGPSWGDLGHLLGRLGRIGDRNNKLYENINFPCRNGTIFWRNLGPLDLPPPLPPPPHPPLLFLPTNGSRRKRAFRHPDHSALAPPLDPSLRGLRPTLERHHSYLALSVTWAGTETERALQELARDGSWHPSLLGALVLRACYVTARSWEPWCSEMFTLPLALGSLGVQSSLRHRSYWEPWRSELFTPSFVLRALAFKTFRAIVRMGAGTLASKLCPSLGRVWA